MSCSLNLLIGSKVVRQRAGQSDWNSYLIAESRVEWQILGAYLEVRRFLKIDEKKGIYGGRYGQIFI